MSENIIKRVFFIVVIVAFCTSCAQKRSDNSLTIDGYRELGIPDPNQQWDMADYAKAHNVLAKMKWERQLQLPMQDSDKSGALFDRMVSIDYLVFLQDSTLTRSEKAQKISEFARVYDYWIDVYTIPTLKANYYNREIMSVRLFNLRLTEAALNLANKINDSDDPADVALQYGYESIKRAYLECVSSYLQPDNYRLQFSNEDMQKMVDSIHHSVLRNKQWLKDNEVVQLKQSLQSAMDSTSSATLKSKYKQLENHLSS